MRAAASALLLFVGLQAAGCSSVIAAFGQPDDLTVVYRGATRDEVEAELGRPRSVRETPHGLQVTYRVRVGERGSPAENAAAVASVFGQSGGVVVSTGGEIGGFLGLLVAVPAAIGTDLVLSTREITRIAKNKRNLTVYYDASGRVIDFTGPTRR